MILWMFACTGRVQAPVVELTYSDFWEAHQTQTCSTATTCGASADPACEDEGALPRCLDYDATLGAACLQGNWSCEDDGTVRRPSECEAVCFEERFDPETEMPGIGDDVVAHCTTEPGWDTEPMLATYWGTHLVLGAEDTAHHVLFAQPNQAASDLGLNACWMVAEGPASVDEQTDGQLTVDTRGMTEANRTCSSAFPSFAPDDLRYVVKTADSLVSLEVQGTLVDVAVASWDGEQTVFWGHPQTCETL
jgi:hypothetical protein